jgi:RHS repeat-associated protein
MRLISSDSICNSLCSEAKKRDSLGLSPSSNALNRLTVMEPTPAGITQGYKKHRFTYDYMSRRVRKQTYGRGGSSWNPYPSLDEKYLYSGWHLVAVYDGLNANQLLRTFTWGADVSGSVGGLGGIGGLLSVQENTGTHAGKYLYVYDATGNVTQLVKASDGTIVAKYQYDPFGRTRVAAGNGYQHINPFRYQTKFTDNASGLIYYGYRYYSHGLGRFLNQDPIGESGGLNLYAFVGNDPVNAREYLGLCATRCYEVHQAINNAGTLVGHKFEICVSSCANFTPPKGHTLYATGLIDRERNSAEFFVQNSNPALAKTQTTPSGQPSFLVLPSSGQGAGPANSGPITTPIVTTPSQPKPAPSTTAAPAQPEPTASAVPPALTNSNSANTSDGSHWEGNTLVLDPVKSVSLPDASAPIDNFNQSSQATQPTQSAPNLVQVNLGSGGGGGNLEGGTGQVALEEGDEEKKKKTDCEEFVDELVNLAEFDTPWWSYANALVSTGYGMMSASWYDQRFWNGTQFHPVLGPGLLGGGNGTRRSYTVTGFRPELVDHGQDSDVMKHILGHAGAQVAGTGLSLTVGYFQNRTDQDQADSGRQQSQVELLNNQVGREVGRSMIDTFKGNQSKADLKKDLMSKLCAPEG